MKCRHSFLLSSFNATARERELKPYRFVVCYPDESGADLRLCFGQYVFLVPEGIRLLFLTVSACLNRLIRSIAIGVRRSMIP